MQATGSITDILRDYGNIEFIGSFSRHLLEQDDNLAIGSSARTKVCFGLGAAHKPDHSYICCPLMCQRLIYCNHPYSSRLLIFFI